MYTKGIVIFAIVAHIASTAVTLSLLMLVIDGISVDSAKTAIIAALILSVLNVTVKPVLKLLTFPLTIATLGLFSLVLNALLFWYVGTVVTGFVVSGFLPAFIGAFILSIVSTVVHKLT